MPEQIMHGAIAIGSYTGVAGAAAVKTPFGRTGTEGITVEINREQMSIESAMALMEVYVADKSVKINVKFKLISAAAANIQLALGLPADRLTVDGVDGHETLEIYAEEIGSADPIGLYVTAKLPKFGTRTLFFPQAKTIGNQNIVIGKDDGTLPEFDYKVLAPESGPVAVLYDAAA